MIRYMLGEELMVVQDDFGFIQMRAPSDEERLYVGHVCFDNRTDIGSKVLDLWPIPYVMSHVSWDMTVRDPLSAFGLQIWKINN